MGKHEWENISGNIFVCKICGTGRVFDNRYSLPDEVKKWNNYRLGITDIYHIPMMQEKEPDCDEMIMRDVLL
jgi:hypothetical protein